MQDTDKSLTIVQAGIDGHLDVTMEVRRKMETFEKTMQTCEKTMNSLLKTVNKLGLIVVGQEETLTNIQKTVDNIEEIVGRHEESWKEFDFATQGDQIKRYGVGIRGIHVLQGQIRKDVDAVLSLCQAWDIQEQERVEKMEMGSDSGKPESAPAESEVPDSGSPESEAPESGPANSAIVGVAEEGSTLEGRGEPSAPTFPGLVLTTPTPVNSQEDAQAIIPLPPNTSSSAAPSPPANTLSSEAPLPPLPPHPPANHPSSTASDSPPPSSNPLTSAEPLIQKVSSMDHLALPPQRHGSPVAAGRRSDRLRSTSRGLSPSGSAKRPPSEETNEAKPLKRRKV